MLSVENLSDCAPFDTYTRVFEKLYVNKIFLENDIIHSLSGGAATQKNNQEGNNREKRAYAVHFEEILQDRT